MKKAVVAIALLAIVAGGGFSVYWWVWNRETTEAASEERQLVEVIADELHFYCVEASATCRVASIERRAPKVWKIRFEFASSPDVCWMAHLDEYRPRTETSSFSGVALIRCSSSSAKAD